MVEASNCGLLIVCFRFFQMYFNDLNRNTTFYICNLFLLSVLRHLHDEGIKNTLPVFSFGM